MTNDPIDLDARRTVTERHETEKRRRPANDAPPRKAPEQERARQLEDEMLA
jgi:hypothetical protein